MTNSKWAAVLGEKAFALDGIVVAQERYRLRPACMERRRITDDSPKIHHKLLFDVGVKILSSRDRLSLLVSIVATNTSSGNKLLALIASPGQPLV